MKLDHPNAHWTNPWTLQERNFDQLRSANILSSLYLRRLPENWRTKIITLVACPSYMH